MFPCAIQSAGLEPGNWSFVSREQIYNDGPNNQHYANEEEDKQTLARNRRYHVEFSVAIRKRTLGIGVT